MLPHFFLPRAPQKLLAIGGRREARNARVRNLIHGVTQESHSRNLVLISKFKRKPPDELLNKEGVSLAI
jgi:hypothetical protein